MTPKLDQIATDLHRRLLSTEHRIVFAESCTAGLVAATLGRIPGISQWLAGSAVVYQLKTKEAWLGVSAETLIDPGAVSRIVSEQMATGALKQTPHATVAASITGHLGPEAPPEEDGTAWAAVAFRRKTEFDVCSRLLRLDDSNATELVESGALLRQQRQQSAAAQLLAFCAEQFDTHTADATPNAE